MSDIENNWIAKDFGSMDQASSSHLYLSSIYFTITTITTVGYGDFSAVSFTEKIINIFIMIMGVIGFSYASGSFTSYIQTNAQNNKVLDEKLELLDKLYKEHNFDHMLYTNIRKNLKSNYVKDVQNVSKFVDNLPFNLRQKLAVEIYKPVYLRVDFLKGKSPKFLSWICPLLKARIAS